MDTILESSKQSFNQTEPKRVIKNLAYYVRLVNPHIPKGLLKPTPSRLVYPAIFTALIFSCVYALMTLELAIWTKLLIGLVMGYCFGANAFVAHELLHGSIVKNKKLQDIIGMFLFEPFLIAPTFWRFWHNKMHHGHTQKIIQDPDAFPTLRIFKQSKYMQRMYKFTPGSGALRSYLYFFFWFAFHNLVSQAYLRFRNRTFDELDHNKTTVEFLFQIVILGGYLYLIGPQNWIWGWVIPFLTMNYMLMSYISTNHNISPLTKHNDPLENSLTVTNHPVLEFLHLNFGYHVEHHLYPTMNPSKVKVVHKVLKEKFPEEFKVMPKREAIKRLYKTPRIYKNSTTLVHPYTGETHPTI